MRFGSTLINTIFLLALAPCGTAAAAQQIVLFDMVQGLASAAAPGALPVFTNTRFLPGSSCMLDYGPPPALVSLDPAVFATPGQPPRPPAFILTHAPWTIASWVESSRFPNLCGGQATATGADGVSLVTPSASGGPPSLGVEIAPDQITLSVNSRDFWHTVYGGPAPLFRAQSSLKVSWPNLFIGANTSLARHDLVWMDQMSELNLVFDGALDAAHIDQKAAWPANRPVPAGAQLEDDPRLHATQIALNLFVQYLLKPEELTADHCFAPNPQQRSPACAYHGKYFHFDISIYDDRFDYRSHWHPSWRPLGVPSFMEDQGTNAMMYLVSLEQLMTPQQRQIWYDNDINPYKHPGTRFRLSCDIYPLIRAAIVATQQRNMLDYTQIQNGRNAMVSALPPLLPGESESQYIGHFAISSGNIGIEDNGLSDISFTVYTYRLSALLNSN